MGQKGANRIATEMKAWRGMKSGSVTKSSMAGATGDANQQSHGQKNSDGRVE